MRRWLVITLVSVLAGSLLGAGWLAVNRVSAEESRARAEGWRAEVWRTHAARAEGFFEAMGPPLPGEWLYHFDEPGQTYAEFVESRPPRKTAERSRVYLQPLGDITEHHPELIGSIERYLAAFFVAEVVRLEPQRLPPGALDADRGQYLVGTILDEQVKRLPDDALMLMALTDQDLYSDGLNFVFGTAYLGHRVGAYSIHRLVDPESEARSLRRTLSTVSHEGGHLLGIKHCVFYQCGISGSNSLGESDGRPIHFCPVDEDKLLHVLGADRTERRRGLAAYFRSVGLESEAEFVIRRPD